MIPSECFYMLNLISFVYYEFWLQHRPDGLAQGLTNSRGLQCYNLEVLGAGEYLVSGIKPRASFIQVIYSNTRATLIALY